MLASGAARAQIGFAGDWVAVRSEANAEAFEAGETRGLPLNDEAVRRAEMWDPVIESLPVWQCRRPAGMRLRLDAPLLQLRNQVDPVSGDVTALRVGWPSRTSFPIFVDRRSHPSDSARHTGSGYATGEPHGNVLDVRTTHLQEGQYRANGIPQSDRAQFTELLMRRTFRDTEYLTWIVIAEDPVYLTEPLVRSTDYRLDVTDQSAGRPCAVVRPVTGLTDAPPDVRPRSEEQATGRSDGEGPRAVGAKTMYPEFRDVRPGSSDPARVGVQSGVSPQAGTR